MRTGSNNCQCQAFTPQPWWLWHMLGLGAARDHMAAGPGDEGSSCSVSCTGVSGEAGSHWSLRGWGSPLGCFWGTVAGCLQGASCSEAVQS